MATGRRFTARGIILIKLILDLLAKSRGGPAGGGFYTFPSFPSRPNGAGVAVAVGLSDVPHFLQLGWKPTAPIRYSGTALPGRSIPPRAFIDRNVEEERDGQLVALAANVATDQVVRLLVERGMPVFEIAPHEETLENFYLRLMKGNGQTKLS